MNERECFFSYMSLEPVGRIPLREMGFWTETLERWHHEGLPKWVTHDRHMEVRLPWRAVQGTQTKLPPTWPKLPRSGWFPSRRDQ